MTDAKKTRKEEGESAVKAFPWLKCDPEIASSMAVALMDAFGDVEEEEYYEVSVPASVVHWVEKHLPKFADTSEMQIDELEFAQIVFQAVFTFMGGVIGQALVEHGYGAMLKDLGASQFMAQPKMSGLVPIAEITGAQPASVH